MGVKIVPRYGATFTEKIYLHALFGGLKTTIRNFTTNIDHGLQIDD